MKRLEEHGLADMHAPDLARLQEALIRVERFSSSGKEDGVRWPEDNISADEHVS